MEGFAELPELKSVTDVLSQTATEINEFFKKLPQNIKAKANDLVNRSKATFKSIPERLRKLPSDELRKQYEDGDITEKTLILRTLAERLNISPVKLVAILIGVGILSVVGIGAIVGVAKDQKNVRGASIDRHRNAMKQLNMKIATSGHERFASQL